MLEARVETWFVANSPLLVKVPCLWLASHWSADVVFPLLIDNVHNLVCLDVRSCVQAHVVLMLAVLCSRWRCVVAAPFRSGCSHVGALLFCASGQRFAEPGVGPLSAVNIFPPFNYHRP